MLTVYIDFKSPASYLALKPTRALAERYGIDLVWRPFRSVERDVPQLGKQETVGESHRRVRAAALRQQAVKYASHQGIDLQFPKDPGSTDLALGILAEWGSDPNPFIDAAFKAYWQAHADLNDPVILAQILQDLGRSSAIDPNAVAASLAHAQAEADEIGIVGAPGYVIQDQIFIGREHLPWIEELISKSAKSA